MNLQSLRTFLVAGEAESLTAAADEFLYAQSTVTTQIKQLEAEWGVKLFRKEGRGVRLTPEGRTILTRVKTIVQQVDMLDDTVRCIDDGGAGHLRIAAIEPVGSWHIAPILAEFSRNRPMLQINYETGSFYSIGARMEQRELEIAITQQPTPDCTLKFEPLYTERMVLLLPQDHTLAAQDCITADDLRPERLMFTEIVRSHAGVREHGLAQYGLDYPYAGIELNSIGVLVQFVQRGVGIGIVPEICVTPAPEGTVIRTADGLDFARQIGFIHPIGERVQQPIIAEIEQTLRRRLRLLDQ